jgi:putative transposase
MKWSARTVIHKSLQIKTRDADSKGEALLGRLFIFCNGGKVMPDYRLRIGMKFKQQGRIYTIEQALPDGHLSIKDSLSGESLAKPRNELLAALFAGKLELLGDGYQSAMLREHLDSLRISELNQLAKDDPLRIEAVRRSRYVERVAADNSVKRNNAGLTPIIRAVSEQIKDERPPSWITLYRWLRDYEAAGRDVRALVPAIKARGNRRRKISGKGLNEYGAEDYERASAVDDLIDQVIRTRYLSANRPTVSSVCENLQARIIDENRLRSPHDQLPIPHISSLYRRVAALDPYEIASTRYGRRYANEQYRVTQRGPRPAHPLERVECDHTRLDLLVVDTETRLPLGRPWLTAMLDVYSRLIHGIYLSFHPPGYLSVMQCLRHAIKSKGYVREVYPEIKHDWPTYGVPELLVVDNAKEFYSRHFEDACLQLGIRVQYAPPRCAWYKGTMERWFGTQNTRLLHELPGATFSNIFERGDYDPQKHAVISLEALLELVHTWIVDLYQQQVQRGVRDIPYRRWIEAISAWPPNLPPRAQELDVLIGCVAERSISNSGIELFTLRYNCPELGLIRRNLGGHKAQLKYDPDDLSLIHVLDPASGKYIPVPALDQEYTRGLTLFQHEIIQRYARRFVSERLDVSALCHARKRIAAIVAQERITQRSLTGRQQVARFLNLGQPDYSRLQRKSIPGASGQAEPGQSQQWPQPATSVEPVLGGGESSQIEIVAAEPGWGADYSLPQREGGRR